MSGQSAFEKRYIDPKDQSKIEGLLELFNLPPKVIAFLKRYKRPLQVGLSIVLIAVVAGSLYTSYRERKVENGASALVLALKETGAEQRGALQRVAEEFAATPAGVWARVELAHLAMKEKKFAEAATAYQAIRQELKAEDPLYGLVLYGLAQAEDAQGNNDAAYAAFESMKNRKGYEMTAYSGMARIHEAKGEYEKALGIYGQYLAMIGDSPEKASLKAQVEAKIARVKAKQ